jgi:hypothetical protein
VSLPIASMTSAKEEYIPGACNIGRAEIKLRRALGWVALGTMVILWGLFIVVEAAAPWRLLLFFPAALAAAGFLQAAWHFCAKFGLGGAFNFGPDVGKTDTVKQTEFRMKDRRTALRIVGLSALAGVSVAAAAYFISP